VRKDQGIAFLGHLQRIGFGHRVFKIGGKRSHRFDGAHRDNNDVVALEILFDLWIGKAGQVPRPHLRLSVYGRGDHRAQSGNSNRSKHLCLSVY
jgi:hypothetical protein